MNPLKFIHTLNETEPEMARREYIARYVLFFLCIVDFTFTLISFILYLFGKMPLDTLVIYSILLIMLFVAMYLTSKGYWRSVGIIPILCIYGVAVNANYIGNIDAPGNFMYALLIILVAIIYDYRKMWIALIICIATYLCLAWMISSGHIIPYRTAETVFINRVVITSGSLVIIALLIWILSRSYITELDERIKAEKALRQSEESYRTIFENTGTSMILIEEDMTISMVNTEFLRKTGYSMDEINGYVKWSDLVHPDEISRIIEQHRLRREITGGALPGYEFRYRTKTGDIRNALINIQLLPGTKKSVASLVDITDRKAVEEALRKSEDKYRIIAENTADLISIMDMNLRLTYVGPTSMSLRGFTPEEAMEQTPEQILTPESLQRNLAVFAEELQLEASGTAEPNRTRILEMEEYKKDGSTIWVEVNFSFLRDNEGKPVEILMVTRDITARKLAEDEVRKSKEKYRALIENIEEVIFSLDTSGQFTYISPAIERISGLKPEKIIGKNFSEFVHPDDLPSLIDSWKRTMSGESEPFEFRVLREGQTRCVLTSSQLITEGAVTVGVTGIMTDITARKLADEKMRESEERFRSMIQSSSDIIFIVDRNGQLTYESPSAARIIGYQPGYFLGKSPFIHIHPDDRDYVMSDLDEVFRSVNPGIPTEFRYRKGDGTWINLEALGSNQFENPGIRGIVLTVRDITARKQAEEAQRILEERLQQADKMEAIGTLAGGIAHDFNNLLMGIQGYASMALLNLDPTNPNYERLKRIEEQVQSGADLTSQLLGFARGGRYEIKPTNINEIIEKTSSLFGRTKKEIAINRKLAKDLWNVEVDHGQMEQVFLNLYVNAWQAMPVGGDIYLETRNVILTDEQTLPFSLKPGKHVKITITDTGTGMDEKTKEKIFEPFFTTKEMGRGTGLGLATVYGIIKGHQGMINVQSETGQGTTFTIYLPATDKKISKEKAPTKEIVKGTERILLVDDEKMVMEVNKDLLESMGYKVYVASSGKECIALYLEKKDEIDLIILDMIMPGISGGETFDRLRKINPNIKVLLSSGYSLTGEAKEIMDRGCNGFIQKPFPLEELSGKVRAILG